MPPTKSPLGLSLIVSINVDNTSDKRPDALTIGLDYLAAITNAPTESTGRAMIGARLS